MASITQRLRHSMLDPVERDRADGTRVVRRASLLQLDTITDLGSLAALKAEWANLFEEHGQAQQVFQTFPWLSTWAQLYVDDATRLSIVTGRLDGRLVLVWPLVVRRSAGLRILTNMGEPLSQYADALIATGLDAASLDVALAHIMALPIDVISLRKVRDDAAIAPILRRHFGAPVHREASPYVDVSGNGSDVPFETRFSGKLRASRRRRRRRLEEMGQVTFRAHGPSAETDALIATALAFKREWATATGTIAPALHDPRFEKFFIGLSRSGVTVPALHVSALRCGADLYGVEISVACKGRLFGHILAPAPHHKQLGLGGILAESTITSALHRGYGVDLLAPADSYKLEWTSTTVGVGDYAMARTAIGAVYRSLWLRWGRHATKDMVQRLQPATAIMSRFRSARSA